MASSSASQTWIRPALRATALGATLGAAFIATATAHADQVFHPIVPGGDGESGTIRLVNPSRNTVEIGLIPVGESAFIQQAVASAGGFTLGPGASVEIPFEGSQVEEDPSSTAALLVNSEGAEVPSWVLAERGAGLTVSRARKTTRATRNFIFPRFENRTDGSAAGRIFIANSLALGEAAVTVTAQDAGGAEIGSVDIPMLFPFQGMEVTGEQLGVNGEATIIVSSSLQVDAGAVVSTSSGFSFITSGRDVAESGQFWYPLWGGASFDGGTVLSNTVGAAGSFTGETILWGRRGTTPGSPQPFSVAPGAIVEQSRDTLAGGSAFLESGAVGIEILTGSVPRAGTARLERTGGDFEYTDPMRRIEPGNHAFAVVPGDDTKLMAESAVVVNNPSDTTAVGELRVRDVHGRVLAKRRVSVKAKNTLTLPMKRVVGRRTTARSLELINPVVNPSARRPVGGGDFQAAIVLSTERIGSRRVKGNGGRLATVVFLPFPLETGPAIVGATVLKADDDRRGQLQLDGRAAGVGRRATLRMFEPGGGPLVAEWKVRVGNVIKVPFRARATNRTTKLGEAWPLGEAREFVLRDDGTGGTSQATLVVRQDGSSASPSFEPAPQ